MARALRPAVLVLALTLPAAPWARAVEPVADVAERLTELGGRLGKDPGGVIEFVDLDSAWLTDADMALLGSLPRLSRLSLSHTRVTDRGVRELRPLTALTALDLSFVQRFTDAGVGALREMSGLRRLALRGTPLTSRALPAIARLAKLEELDLSHTHVSDENFDELLALTELRRLAVGGTLISGSALPMLRLLPKLEELDLGGVQRVDSGVWGFRLFQRRTWVRWRS